MPVQYIRVRKLIDMFSPAARAFGNICFVGKVDETQPGIAAVNTPIPITNPADAILHFPGDLGDSIATAFRQTPGPSLVYGVRVDATTPNWRDAFNVVSALDVQFVVVAN